MIWQRSWVWSAARFVHMERTMQHAQNRGQHRLKGPANPLLPIRGFANKRWTSRCTRKWRRMSLRCLAISAGKSVSGANSNAQSHLANSMRALSVRRPCGAGL